MTSQIVTDYVEGRFIDDPSGPADDEYEVRSPADLSDVVAHGGWRFEHVERAVRQARDVQRTWRQLPAEQRDQLMRRFGEQVRENTSAIAETISRETGKPLWEARTEVLAVVSKVELTLGLGRSFTAEREVMEAAGAIRYRAVGTLAVIGPFNFPCHLPVGQIVPALIMGNTVVFKPSERTPASGAWIARCMHAAGVPSGVFSFVQGGARIGQALAAHPGIDGVLFTGSVPVGQQIAQASAANPHRLLVLELGGKNSALVLADADLTRAARDLAFGAYATAGQRCTSTARVYVERSVAEPLIEKLAALARGIRVASPRDAGAFMGPVISEASLSRIIARQADARAHGYDAVVPGGRVDDGVPRGHYLQPALHLAVTPRRNRPRSAYETDELFGPDLAVEAVDSLDEGIELANSTQFGLAAAVFTTSREQFEHAAANLDVGVVHWNRPTAGASGHLPFGGTKQSGNHRALGILAGQTTAFPQGLRYAPANDEKPPQWPGFPDI